MLGVHCTLFIAAVMCAVTAQTVLMPLEVEIHLSTGDLLSSCPAGEGFESCTGGLPAALAYARARRRAGRTVVHLPNLDRLSLFAQMHPLSWGVNGLTFDQFGVASYLTTGSLVHEERVGIETLYSVRSNIVLGNTWVRPSNDWFSLIHQWHIENGVAFCRLYDERFASSDDSLTAMEVGIRRVRRRNDVALVVVNTGGAAHVSKLLRLAALDHPPDVVWLEDDGLMTQDPAGNFTQQRINSTLFYRVAKETALTAVTITTDGARVMGASAVEIDLHALDSTYHDAEWFQHQSFLEAEQAKATLHNPVLGVASTPMPLSREGSYRLCMGGECAIANLFMDAMRFRSGSNLAMTNSGGFRGPGWPAGPIRVSDLWVALPFSNTVCTGKLMGLTLWQILNHSTALASFSTQRTDTGNHLMQLSGVRIVYNSNLHANRLLSVEIFENSTQQYEPLQRLKVYSFSVESFLCKDFHPYVAYLTKAQYPGEVAGILGEDTMQDIAETFIRKTSPIDHSLRGSHIDVASAPFTLASGDVISSASVPVNWIHRPETCPQDTYWDGSVDTCISCPDGTHQPSTGQLDCIVSSGVNLGLVVGLPVTALVLLVAGAAVVTLRGKFQGARNLSNAPKSGQVCIVFTDIQSSTVLWSSCPQCMGVALDLHHSIMRSCIAANGGYEVKTVGDSFMVAFASPVAAVQFCVDAQEQLQHTRFPLAIQTGYELMEPAGRVRLILDDDPENLAAIHPVYNGLRVRMGAHYGTPEIVFDEVTKGYDYYGNMVNLAARVASAATGGQVLCTAEVHEKLGGMFAVNSASLARLRGIPETVELFEIVVVPDRIESEELSPVGIEVVQSMNIEPTEGLTVDLSRVDEIARVRALRIVRAGIVSVQDAEDAFEQLSFSYISLLRVMSVRQRSQFVSVLCKAWRVRERKSPEKSLKALSVRILPYVLSKSESFDGASMASGDSSPRFMETISEGHDRPASQLSP